MSKYLPWNLQPYQPKGPPSQDPEYDNEAPSGAQPEKQLIAAVIARALLDAVHTRWIGWRDDLHAVKREAKRWLNSDSEREFGFVWCSHALYQDGADRFIEKTREAVKTGKVPDRLFELGGARSMPSRKNRSEPMD